MRKDRLGYYSALGVGHDAPEEEIELAFQLLKRSYRERRAGMNIRKVQAAYETLSDPQRRRAYDGAGTRTGASRVSQPAILGLLLLVLVVVVAFLHGGEIRARLTRFAPGDHLVTKDTGERFGSVQAFEAQHLFFNGTRAPAYLIETNPATEAEWYPARDLNRICATE